MMNNSSQVVTSHHETSMSTFLLDSYDHFMGQGDKRILSYPFMESPQVTISLCTLYFLFVKYIGPRFMKNREPFELRIPMILYNFSMVLLNGYLFWYFGVYGWFGKYNIKCQPVDYSNSPDALGMIFIGWIFYFSKFIEFLDTIFFVLRKKTTQVTTLHIIHHATMPFNVWFTIRFAPGGHSSFCSFVNSFVHVVMYTYYGLAAIGPSMAPYIWWKKYITKLQLTQFILVFTHSFQLLFRECDYPRIFMAYIGFYSVLFLFMFSDFYIKAYKKSMSDSKSMLSESKPLSNGKSLDSNLVSSESQETKVSKVSNGATTKLSSESNISQESHANSASSVPTSKSLNQVIKKLM